MRVREIKQEETAQSEEHQKIQEKTDNATEGAKEDARSITSMPKDRSWANAAMAPLEAVVESINR